MAKRYSKAAHSKRRKQTSHVLKNTVILLFCAVGIWFGSSLWHAALTLQTAQPAESIAGEEFRPQVGDPPYRVVIDAGHGGTDPGARGVIEEKDMTAATASELIRLLQQDSNFIPLQTRDSFDETATPAQRAARADEQAPQLLLSIHCQHCRTIYIFQQRKASLCTHLGVGAFHQLLLIVFQIINVSDSPAPTQRCSCSLHSFGKQLRKVKAFLMPSPARHCRIALKAGCSGAICS